MSKAVIVMMAAMMASTVSAGTNHWHSWTPTQRVIVKQWLRSSGIRDTSRLVAKANRIPIVGVKAVTNVTSLDADLIADNAEFTAIWTKYEGVIPVTKPQFKVVRQSMKSAYIAASTVAAKVNVLLDKLNLEGLVNDLNRQGSSVFKVSAVTTTTNIFAEKVGGSSFAQQHDLGNISGDDIELTVTH